MAVPLKQKRGGSYNQIPQQIKCNQVTLVGGNRKRNAGDIYRQNRNGTHSRTVPIPGKTYRNHKMIQNIAYREGKPIKAIIIQDNTIDAILITQLSMTQYFWR